MPKKSAHCRNGLVNVAIAGKFVDVNNIVKLLSKKYHFFNGLEPKGNEQATVNFWLQRGLCDSFYKDFSKIRAEKNIYITTGFDDSFPYEKINKISNNELAATRKLIASPLTDRNQVNELWKMCEKLREAIAATYSSNCYLGCKVKQKQLKRLRTILRAKVREVTANHVEAAEVLAFFEDKRGNKLREIQIPTVNYVLPDGRKGTRAECLFASTKHWREILDASRHNRYTCDMSFEYVHFMISRYSCLDAYLSAQRVGDTSRMHLVVLERAIAMLVDIKIHFSHNKALSAKVAYALRLERQFADWMLDVKAMYYGKVIKMATVSPQLDMHHINEAIKQIEMIRHGVLSARSLVGSILQLPEFFLLDAQN